MNLQEAFLYNWHDRKLNMDYLGYHKGNPEDGYICSHIQPKDGDPWMLEEYKKRPEDFTRIILAYGTLEECRNWERIVLVFFDAARSPKWYNKHNGGTFFVTKNGKEHPMYGRHHTEEIRNKQSERMKGNSYSKGKPSAFKGKRHKSESIEKIKENHADVSGKNNPNYGKHWSEEFKDQQRRRMKGNKIMKGRPRKIVICPICGKQGGGPSMKRYHFDNCRIIHTTEVKRIIC